MFKEIGQILYVVSIAFSAKLVFESKNKNKKRRNYDRNLFYQTY